MRMKPIVAGLLLASLSVLAPACSKDKQVAPNSTEKGLEKQQVMISLSPLGGGFRAQTTLPEVEGHHLRYVLELYRQNADGSLGALAKHIAQVSPDFTVEVDRSERYTIVGWADFVPSGDNNAQASSTQDAYYNTQDLTKVSINTQQWGLNTSARDAFCATAKDFALSQSGLVLTLKRPLSLLNIKAEGLDEQYKSLKISYKEVYTGFNVVAGTVIEESKLAKVVSVAMLSNEQKVVAFDYLFTKPLADGVDYQKGSTLQSINLELYTSEDATGEAQAKYDVPRVPFAMNYKTNLIVRNPKDVATIHFEIAPDWETPEIQGNYELVFSDEFEGDNNSQPDPKKWKTHPRYNSTWNRYISTRSDVAYLEDGKLILKAFKNDNKTAEDPRDYVSGAITTQGKYTFQYGRVEARIRTKKHVGNFPAFWLMPRNAEGLAWPACGEIDIWEQINAQDKAFHTVHSHYTWDKKYSDKKGNDIQGLGIKDKPVSHFETLGADPNEWHVYGLEWTADALTFYLDGKKAGSYPRLQDERIASEFNGLGQYPFRKPYYIILNQSIGDGSWASNPDPNFVYQTEVDWVRVYQLKGTEPVKPVQ